MSLRVTDDELNELTRTLVGGGRLKLDQRIPPQLKDGRYFLHSHAISFAGHPKWVLSIYRNVIETGNDLEIAIDPWPLAWPSDSPKRYEAALRWLEEQMDLEHLPSGVHIKEEKKQRPVDLFRIGLKLDGARKFVRRLQLQLMMNEPQRWVTEGTESSPLPSSAQPQQLAPQPVDPVVAVVDQMLRTVHQTCAQSGSQSVVTAKVKEWRFDSDEHFRGVVSALLATSGGRCALTGVALDMSSADGDLAPSLDRIDSDGHYEPGNIQVVARFANRWKSDDSDANFLRLLALVEDARPVQQ